MQFTMISSNGTRFVANAHRNPNLFFALRGGGGGTYGVVTSVTYQTHPNLPLVSATFSASTNAFTPTAALQELLTDLVKVLPQLSDDGWGGSALLVPDPNTGHLGLSMSLVLFNGTMEQANQTIAPFFTTAEGLVAASDNELTIQIASTTAFDSFFSWYTTTFSAPSIAGLNGAVGSWLLPRDVIESEPERVAQTLLPLTGLTLG